MSEESSAASSESIDYEEDSDYDLDEDKCMETTEIENAAEESYLVGTVEHVTFAHKGTQTIAKCRPRASKYFYIFSTKHHQPEMYTANKPTIVNFYNHGKSGIDIADEMVHDYSFNPITRCWTFRLFIWLLDICALNANVIYQKQMCDIGKRTKSSSHRANFLENFALQLMEEEKKARASSESSKNYIYAEYRELAEKMQKLQKKLHGEKPNSIGYCEQCKGRARESHLDHCQGRNCGKSICDKCRKIAIYCDDCLHKQNPPTQPEPKKKIPTRANPAEHPGSSFCHVCGKKVIKFCLFCATSICAKHGKNYKCEKCS